MSERRWREVDRYIEQQLVGDDRVLEQVLRASADAGLPSIALSPAQGKLLYLLASMREARSILEVGTLGAYSTIWLARALPADGRLVTLELNPRYAEVAAANAELADAAGHDPGAQGMRRFHELLDADQRVSATTIQTVGEKGYDGFTLALVER